MVVSTSLMTGAMSLSTAVSLSMERVSSEFSSSPTTSSAKPSVTSSRTRWDCSVFLRRSAIWEAVATLTRSFLLSSRPSSSIVLRLRGSARAISRVPFCALQGHEVVTEHQVDRDGAEQVVVDGAVAQVDELAAIARGDGLRLGGFAGRIDESGFVRRHKKRVLGPGCWVLAYSSQTVQEFASTQHLPYWVLGSGCWVLAYSSQTVQEAASTQHLAPSTYLIVSASEKIGRYNAINTNATKHPMKIMMAGSISDRAAVMRVFTSSS